jgi:hypothetical protein
MLHSKTAPANQNSSRAGSRFPFFQPDQTCRKFLEEIFGLYAATESSKDSTLGAGICVNIERMKNKAAKL